VNWGGGETSNPPVIPTLGCWADTHDCDFRGTGRCSERGGANVRSWYRVHTRLVRSAAAVCAFIRLLGAGEMSISSVVYISAQQHGPSTHVRRPRTPAVMFSALTKLTKTVSTLQKRKRKYKIWFGLCRV